MKRTACIVFLSTLLTVPALAGPVDWNAGVVYQYDGSGNIKQIGTDAYLYDTAQRLIQGSVAGSQHNYTYDSFGNRTGCAPAVGGNCQLGVTIDSSTNRIAGRSYDARGNVLQQPNGSAFAYDELGMVKKETVSNGAVYYIYTSDDERIAVYDSNTAANTHFWRWTVRGLDKKLLREYTSNTSSGTGDFKWFKDHIWRDSLLLASRQLESSGTASTYHYHVDHLGTPRQVTNDSAQVIGKHDYYAFGVEHTFGNPNEPRTQNLKFTGHERDGALDYMHARYYDAGAGRFLSVDPSWASTDLSQPQTWNRYTYAQNSPLRYTDPDGRAAVAIEVGVVAVLLIGGAILAEEHLLSPSEEDPSRTNAQVMASQIVGGLEALQGGLTSLAEHVKGKRPSTKAKHEKGQRRKEKDRGNEKGDERRRPPRKRPRGHSGPWPFVPVPIPDITPQPAPEPTPAPEPQRQPEPQPPPKEKKREIVSVIPWRY